MSNNFNTKSNRINLYQLCFSLILLFFISIFNISIAENIIWDGKDFSEIIEKSKAVVIKRQCKKPLTYEGGFSRQEVWAWNNQLCMGLPIDMSQYPGNNGKCDFININNNKNYQLREKFFKIIIKNTETSEIIKNNNFFIISCSKITGGIDINPKSNFTIGLYKTIVDGDLSIETTHKNNILFDKYLFEKIYIIGDSKIGVIRITDSVVKKSLNIHNTTINSLQIADTKISKK